ncbi:MAG: PQQ-binding-like beta-propeller repeat protein [bacterium]
MIARAFIFVLIAAAGGGYCNAIAAETNAVFSWPIYHGDAALSGVAGTALPDKLMVLWRHKVGAGVSVSPVMGGNMIFFVAENGYLSVLTPQGKKIWSMGIEKDSVSGEAKNDRARKFVTPPLFIRDTVVTGSDDGWLCAMEATTGKTRWRYKVGQSINGTANWVEQAGDRACGIVVMSQWDGIVHCIDLASGKARWTSPEVAECDGSPGVGSDFVVFGSCDMALHMLSSSKGEVLGSVALGDEGQVAGGVAVSGGLAFAGTYNGTVACSDVRKKTIVWTNKVAKAEAFATPAVTTDRVVAGSNDGFVYCLDRRDGKIVWSFNAGDTVLSPVVAGDKIVVSSGGTLYILKLQDGSKVWSVKAGDHISSPAVADGKVVIGTDDGFVIMYGAAPVIK